jgi:hypothetical protein
MAIFTRNVAAPVLALLASPAFGAHAAPAAAAQAPTTVALSTPAATAPGSFMPAGAPYWLKTYSTAPYQEYWTGVLTVKDLAKDLPRVLKAAEKEKSPLAQDLKSFASSARQQQLVFLVPGERGKALFKRLRKLGDLPEPDMRTLGPKLPLDEIRAKIDRLMKERAEHDAELKHLPVALEIEEEVLERLVLVEEIAKQTRGPVRFNLLVQQR